MKTHFLHIHLKPQSCHFSFWSIKKQKYHLAWSEHCNVTSINWSLIKKKLPRLHWRWRWHISCDDNLTLQQRLPWPTHTQPNEPESFDQDLNKVTFDVIPLEHAPNKALWLITLSRQWPLHNHPLPLRRGCIRADSFDILFALPHFINASACATHAFIHDHQCWVAHYQHNQLIDVQSTPLNPHHFSINHIVQQWPTAPIYICTIDQAYHPICEQLNQQLTHSYWWQPINNDHFVAYCVCLENSYA